MPGPIAFSSGKKRSSFEEQMALGAAVGAATAAVGHAASPKRSRLALSTTTTTTPAAGTTTAIATVRTTDTAMMGGSSKTFGAITTSGSSSAENKFTTYLLQQQLETFQLEIEHERSLRLLDQKRFRQAQTRLEQQVEFAKEEADQAKVLLEQLQSKHEKMTSQLRDARNSALQELRQCQMEREDLARRVKQQKSSGLRFSAGQENDDDEDDDDGDHDSIAKMWRDKCFRLEQQVKAQEAREAAMKLQFEHLNQDVNERFHAIEEASLSAKSSPHSALSPILETAPPAVMKELNRIRILLAESECRERQLKRKVDEWQQTSKQVIQEREQARLSSQRLVTVEKEVRELRAKYDTMAAESTAWNAFGESLAAQLKRQNIQWRGGSSASGGGAPPEVATIIRFMDQAQSKAEELEKQNKRLQQEYQRLKTDAIPAENKIKDMQQVTETSIRGRQRLESKLEASESKIALLESQQAIYKREIESLRALIKTFDDMPVAPRGGAAAANHDLLSSPKLNTSLKRMEVSLASVREELEVITAERDRLLKDLEQANQGRDEKEKELDTVKEKFGKLRDALHAERAKVEVAEARANQAEARAGKGEFNPETTRVMHIKETPLTEALREEMEVLKRQLEAANKGVKSSQLAADPEKLNQRLKENFKEQISLFREGVYLMTGFKVDMLPGQDRPTFRVRSMYAEQEGDCLMLKWPAGDNISTLDLLTSDYAKQLTTTPSYDYITKFRSLPGFMASVQLSLFETQTVPMH